MKNQIKAKIFVIDSRYKLGFGYCGQELAEKIESVAKSIGLDAKVDFAKDKEGFALKQSELPKDYDFYFMHLSNVDGLELEKIKSNQPYSHFIGISGISEYVPEVWKKEMLDELYNGLGESDIESILKNGWMNKK